MAVIRFLKQLPGWPATAPIPNLRSDNRQAVRILTADTPELVTRLRHIDVLHHWLRQACQRNEVDVNWITNTDMTADGMTKPLLGDAFRAFLAQLGMTDIRQAYPGWTG
jgi:hypothetical protein